VHSHLPHPHNTELLYQTDLLLCYLRFTTAPLSTEQRRPLILMSKTIQNLANDIRFGAKEKYMMPANPFIDANTERIRQFFDEISVRLLELPFPIEPSQSVRLKPFSCFSPVSRRNPRI